MPGVLAQTAGIVRWVGFFSILNSDYVDDTHTRTGLPRPPIILRPSRQHVWSQSIGDFNTSPGPGTDIHSLRAEDKSVNTERSNKDFVEGGTSVPDCGGCRETSESFEPPNVSKGQVARMLFYMATRWNGSDNSRPLTIIDGTGSSSGSGTIGDLQTLKDWHNSFPPTVEEYNRKWPTLSFVESSGRLQPAHPRYP